MPWYDNASSEDVASHAPTALVVGTLVALFVIVAAGSTVAVLTTLLAFLLPSSSSVRRRSPSSSREEEDAAADRQGRPVTSSSPHGGGDDEMMKMEISKCPNPDCVRCRRYAELNDSARRRLPWIVSSLTSDGSGAGAIGADGNGGSSAADTLARIVRAVRSGPDPERDGDDEVTEEGMSPAQGQRPTVLLVRDLAVRSPIVTSLHRDACGLLEGSRDGNGTDSRGWLELILEEYRAASSPRYVDVDLASSSASTSWLRNDTASADGRWDVLHLLNQGAWVDSNVSACPRTVDAVRSLPGLMDGCVFGNAFISVLRPGTDIEPHCGPSNVRHRLHFPLLVPQPPLGGGADDTSGGERGGGYGGPELRVAGERIDWTEGRCVVFDDSLVHSARYPRPSRSPSYASVSKKVNRKNAKRFMEPPPRVVLIVDLWHPDLTDVERRAVADLYPAAVAVAAGKGK